MRSTSSLPVIALLLFGAFIAAQAQTNELQALGKTYELHLYAEDDHSLSIHRLDRDQKVILWFQRYMK
jgi:hypothetical protein